MVWHAIIAFGKHTRCNDVGRGMSSLPLDGKHGLMTSGVTCHHRLWKAHTVEQRWAWLDITTLGIHARLDDVGRGMTSSPLDSKHGWKRRAFHDTPPLDSTHGRQRQVWHDITALGQHTQSVMLGVA